MNQPLKLITETYEDIETLITEGDNGKKSYYISGPYISTELQNRNGRFYPRSVIESQMPKQLQMIAENRAVGELNHPNAPTVNPERACHLIKELKWVGNDVIGKSKVLESLPMGKIVVGLIDEGVKFGVSTRGMGSVRANSKGISEVQNDFRLVCVDAVFEPSGMNCWVGGIMEGAAWIYDEASDSFIEAAIEKTKENIEESVRSRTLDLAMKTKLFEQYIEVLAKVRN